MAVDQARYHLNLLPTPPPQLIPNNRDFCATANEEVNYINKNQMCSFEGIPFTGTTTLQEALFPAHYQSSSSVLLHELPDSIPAKLMSMNKSDSGLTYNHPHHTPTTATTPPQKRRRSRDTTPTTTIPHKSSTTFLGQDFSYQIQQHQSEIDQLVLQHTKKMRLEVEEKQRQLMSRIGEGVGKRLKEREEQLQRMGKLNWVLQERVKSLHMENQVWRELAHTNEATANSLRTNLEQVLLLAQVSGGQDDAEESCCDSNSGGGGRDCGEEEAEGRRLEGVKDKGGRVCRKCGEREACVLLLPCRHLCLCTVCGSTLLHTCPVCNSNMDVTLHVNMS